ncbi:MAG: septal ring lytic transglycosylase RlpA family protein [Methylibium sp.]|uniref:septal ring lytic transglycosylase RlpA family protein n=1 Tax=Methylibium sp. TaxID=2067992 RepID=UPI00185C8FCC|nr:septal ring lytic transglycosylase RlpA family protein [Methylibium sp.]MBA3598335.1 septal ring lytic transglycosylase RlpA family protein [Methylibium sp.]
MRLRFVLAATALIAAGSHAQPVAPAKAAPATSAGTAANAEPAKTTRGKLSYYGHRFAGQATASGEIFDPEALTMAHRTLPFGTRVRVTNRKNSKSVVVRVNDRGPAIASRIGDVSLAAARRLGMLKRGVIEARLEVLAPDEPPDKPAAER